MDDVNANEFLTIKSTEQQIKEGVERPVDTAFVEEHDGQLLLKAVFDVHHFKPEEVSLKVCFAYFAFDLITVNDSMIVEECCNYIRTGYVRRDAVVNIQCFWGTNNRQY